MPRISKLDSSSPRQSVRNSSQLRARRQRGGLAVLFGVLAALACAGCGVARPVSYPMPASHAARPAMPLSGKTSGRFQSRIVSWQELKSRNVVIQDLDYSCGAAALATLLQFYFGDNVSEVQLLDRILGKLSDESVKDR